MHIVLYANNNPLHIGDNFFAKGDYNSAITEYKRYLFLNNNISRIDDLYFKISRSYKELEDWENSILAMNQSINYSNSDSIRLIKMIELATLLYANDQPEVAKLQLLMVVSINPLTIEAKKATLLRGLISIYTSDLHGAINALETIESTYPINSTEYKFPMTNNRSSVLTATLLSSLVPGFGQLYVRDIKSSINAIILNLPLGYLLVNSLQNSDYFNSIIIFNLFQRYYLGNIRNAKNTAIKHNLNVLEQRFEYLINQNLNMNINIAPNSKKTR